ncbi:DUF3873 domain-containing protein [Dysgonomonas sp. 216]|uniref:DUF3873 family protein n=1 Tax=Dysgonomonas sp. 216 TaxID=2302934 RepID=UPI0013D23FB8|nr:DUF3873 domain-containing protein [Dysgonomonas sp. 216]
MSTNSINDNNGSCVCEQGKENYITFRPAHRPRQIFYQYDFRYAGDGELFSCVAPSLEECRKRRDEWLRKKSERYKLFIGIKKIGEFDTISQAKQYAQTSGYTGVFNLLGKDYRDSWYVFANDK